MENADEMSRVTSTVPVKSCSTRLSTDSPAPSSDSPEYETSHTFATFFHSAAPATFADPALTMGQGMNDAHTSHRRATRLPRLWSRRRMSLSPSARSSRNQPSFSSSPVSPSSFAAT